MRRTLGLSILWAFAGNLCTAAEIPMKLDFEAYKLYGRWYPIARITDHRGMDHLSTLGKYIMPTSTFSLNIDFYYVKDEKDCYLEMVSFLQAETPLDFITVSNAYKLDGYKVHFMDTDYKEYNIFQMERDGKKALFLDGRKTTVSAAVRKKFLALALSLGFSVDKIRYVPNNGYCLRNKLFY